MPRTPLNFLFLRFLTRCSTPLLLNPNELMIELLEGILQILGFGFPYCGLGVIVPTSIKPNPKDPSALK